MAAIRTSAPASTILTAIVKIDMVPGYTNRKIILPPPNIMKQHFTVHGALLPGYTLEGQVTEKSVSAPGRDSGKPQRASVLEKLSDAKKQEKAAPPKAPDKKKEDIHR